MNPTEEFSFSAKKIRDLTTIAEGRVYTLDKNNLIRLFVKAGAVRSGTDKIVILKFGDHSLDVIINSGRGCSPKITNDANVKDMAGILLKHVLEKMPREAPINWSNTHLTNS